MNAMERLINGYFDLKEQTERDQSSNFAQIMILSDENKRLKEEVSHLNKVVEKSTHTIETIKAFLTQLAEDKTITESEHQELLRYIKEVDMIKYEEEEEEDE